jgi:serine/threonine protein kinase
LSNAADIQTASSESAPIATLGRYSVVREIGRGATSIVYLAHDSFNGHAVAIKVFSIPAGHVSDQTSMQSKAFLSEAALVGRLKHPHIVGILDAATEDGLSYIVMEYVDGVNLDAHVEPHTLLPLKEVVEIAFKCGKALELAIREGVIHRDIKPGNLLRTSDGDIKISDFGAALFSGKDGLLAAQNEEGGMVVGSPAYMSPEQIRGGILTHQSDIYSLGVVMYRLLTGKLPFAGNSPQSLAYSILNTDPPRPSSLRPTLPPVLDGVVMRAIAKNPSSRYATWQEFCRDLSLAFSSLRTDGEAVSDSEKFQFLRSLPFFSGFSDVDLWEIVRIAYWKSFRRDQSVIREGEIGDALYVLVKGDAEVSIRGQRVSVLKPGACFGEMLYFEDSEIKRGTTVSAKNSCEVVELKASAMRAASAGVQAEFNKACMKVLMDRVGTIHARFAMLKAGDE